MTLTQLYKKCPICEGHYVGCIACGGSGFVEQRGISCPKAIDRVALEGFMEDVCDIVGYSEPDEED